jgi:hypothetical protein
MLANPLFSAIRWLPSHSDGAPAYDLPPKKLDHRNW